MKYLRALYNQKVAPNHTIVEQSENEEAVDEDEDEDNAAWLEKTTFMV